MSKIIEYTDEQLRQFSNKLIKSYASSLTSALTYNEFRANAFNLMYNEPKSNGITPVQDGDIVRIAPDTKEILKIIENHSKEIEDIKLNAPSHKKDALLTDLFKKIIKPKFEFEFKIPFVPVDVSGTEIMTPMWFNTTMKGINMRLGYDNGDAATPSRVVLGDNVVHMMLGGRTGSGKSVALNTIECNLLLEYAPWELDIYLGDFKKVEGARYANRIPAPSMRIVAATGSTEFILSMYKEIIREMNDRQAIFNACNVQKIEDFRKKFNLVMPRVILIVDEFTQMYENIKASESLGNDNASEDKKVVNSALSDIARLGRSMGIHMCLSSQQLDNLDDSVANQFGGGATLGAPPSVSNSLIGNDAGADIRGKGKGFYNMNKSAKSKKDNVLVRIPYLESEQSEEDAAKGKLTNLLEILQQCHEQAEAVGYHKELIFYDEDAPIPRQLYDEACEYSHDVLMHKEQSKTLDDEIFVKDLLAYLPLGKEIRLSDEPVYSLVLTNQKNNAIIVNATDDSIRNYIIKLLALDFKSFQPNAKHFVINGDSSITLKCELDKLPNLNFKNTPEIPMNLISVINLRKMLIDLQNSFNEKGDSYWNDDLFWSKMASIFNKQIKLLGLSLKEIANKVKDIVNALQNAKPINEVVPEGLENWKVLVESYQKYKNTFNIERNKGVVTNKTLRQQVYWLVGLENFNDIDDSEYKKSLKWILENASTVNITIIVTGKIWSKTGSLVETVNNVIERCDKSFFNDIALPKSINANPRSIQVHNRNLKERHIVSLYSGI